MSKDTENQRYAGCSLLGLLQTHPVNRKDNLGKIAEALEIEFDTKERKTDLTLKIESALKDDPDLERTVRAIATVFLDEYEQVKADKKKNEREKNLAPEVTPLVRSPTFTLTMPSPPKDDTQTTQDDLFTQNTALNDSVISIHEYSTTRKTLFFSSTERIRNASPNRERNGRSK